MDNLHEAWTNLDGEIITEEDLVGSSPFGSPPASPGTPAGRGQRRAWRDVKLGEGALQGGVDAMHGVELLLLHLVV